MTKEEVGLWLRVIQINDVYELDNLSNFKTLCDEKRQEGPDKTLVVLPGDFLAPSLLSSLDRGAGMVDILNRIGIDYVCIGNHESDVGNEALAKRIHQSQFPWINSNIPELNEKLGVETKTHEYVTVQRGDKKKTVGLIGLMIDDVSGYRPGSWGGAKIESVLETAEKYVNLMKDECDLLLPMTHQYIHEDRVLANKYTGELFPIMLAAHEHEPFDETHSGCRIIKVGCEAEFAAVIDFQWMTTTSEGGKSLSDKPVIQVDPLIPTKNYAKDPEIEKYVKQHQSVLHELETANIFQFSDFMTKYQQNGEPTFSTAGNRLGPNCGTEILCSILRMAMRAEVAICNAGSIRRQHTYPPEQEYFTWSNLKEEIPFPTELVAVPIPGHILETMITNSRQKAKLTPPIEAGGFLHHCDQIKYDLASEKIISVAGHPFDPNQKLVTCIPASFFDGMDNHTCLLDWAESENLHLDKENGRPAKLVVVELFSALLWLEMGSFMDIDKDGKGVISRDDIKRRACSVFGEGVADLVTDSILGVADLDGDGTVTAAEMATVRLVASDILSKRPSKKQMRTMSMVVSEVVGQRPSHTDVRSVISDLKNLGVFDEEGEITPDVLGEVKRRSLLM